jgi:predicted DCC family thiol-disulfide oxidoreductase YuxK
MEIPETKFVTSPYIALRAARGKHLPTASEFLLAYDAGCGPCSRFKELVEFLDPRNKVAYISLDDAEKASLLEGIPSESRFTSFHLLSTGREQSSANGAPAVLLLLRVLAPLGDSFWMAFEKVPGSVALVSRAYGTLSRLHRSCSPLQRALRGFGG